MQFFPSNPDLALFTLRLALGIVFLARGPIKIVDFRTIAHKLNRPPYAVLSIGLLKTVSAVLIILGIWTQIAALILMAVILRAVYIKTQRQDQDFTGASGWELEFILLAIAMTVFLAGGGEFKII